MPSPTVVTRRIGVAVAVLIGAALVTLSLPFSPVRAVIVSGTSMQPGMQPGDLVIAVQRGDYRRDDIVVFRVPDEQAGAGNLVIHRIVGGESRNGYWVRGDNREGRDPWRPTEADIVGEAALLVPRIGLAPTYLRTSAGLAMLAALVTMATFFGTGRRPDRVAP